VTEFVGLLLIYAGYRYNIREPAPDASGAEADARLAPSI
jgi:hypothetical protein